MQLEQNETFEIKGPQLEVFGKAESRLPAPARRRPTALAVLALAVVLSVFGISGARLRTARSRVTAVYSASVNEHGHGIQDDLNTQIDNAANLLRQCQGVLGEEDPRCTQTAALIDQWQTTPATPSAQYALITSLDSAVDDLYNTARAQASGSALDRIEGLSADYASTQAILEREIAQDYTPAAREFNETLGAFPANLLAPLWGVDEAEAYGPASS